MRERNDEIRGVHDISRQKGGGFGIRCRCDKRGSQVNEVGNNCRGENMEEKLIENEGAREEERESFFFFL